MAHFMRTFLRVFLFISIAILTLASCQRKDVLPHYTAVKIGDTTVKAKVSDTDATRIRGLQGVTQLPENEGMLFIYYYPRVLSHWMKDMRISLDIIWINADKKIVTITEKVPICQAMPCPGYSSGTTAKYVLEVNAGFAARHHLQPGMGVSFNES